MDSLKQLILDEFDHHFRMRRRVLLGLGMAPATLMLGCSNSDPAPTEQQTSATKGSSSANSILQVSSVSTGTSVASSFVHPGMLHTESDFQRMRDKLAANSQPWVSGWTALQSSSRAQISASTAPNPVATVIRGADGENFRTLVEDLRRAYQFALRWKVSGDTTYADMAVRFLDAWSATLTKIDGDNDRYIVAGLYGYQFANAAEIMRSYPGWPATKVQQFQTMMLNVFYPLCSEFDTAWTAYRGDDAIGPWASWSLLTACGLMAIGILCDRMDIHDQAISYYKSGRSSGSALHNVFALHPGYLGQWQESGRDPGHCTLSIGLAGMFCEMAWNQGTDLYSYLNNRLLAASEYVAKSNLSDANGNPYVMPFSPFHNLSGSATAVAGQDTPSLRPMWEVLYNHYVNRKGISAPWTTAMAAKLRPETDQWIGDDPNCGTLTFSRDPVAAAKPAGLTAMVSGNTTQLSWWGSAGAGSYNVKRATTLNGTYQTIANVSGLCTYSDSPGSGNWFYTVTALTNASESSISNRVAATLPHALRLRIPFNDGSGTTATNLASTSPVTLAAGASWGAGRTAGSNALSLGGGGAYVQLPSNLTDSLADFTLSAWVYMNSALPDARLVDIGSDDISYMALVPCDSNGQLIFVISGASWHGEQSVSASGPFPSGRWAHLAVRLSGATGTLFIDGASVATSSSLTNSPHDILLASNAWIGRSQFGHPTFNGRVQDLRLYAGGLSDAEVAALSA